MERRSDFDVSGGNAEERGRNVLSELLGHTADGSRIAQDEFEVIAHENGKYTVVLPGVTDLSNPDLGLNDEHRTVRDLDQHALQSNLREGVGNNRYAQMVQEWFERQIESGAIPEGADVMLVGHSFGGDTAFDLAGSSEFNGGLVNVTHVVSAGYASEHQLHAIPDGTEAFVFQNIYDVPTIAESLPHSGETFRDGGRIAVEGVEDVAGLTNRGINGIGSVVEFGVDLLPGGLEADLPDLPEHVTFVSDNRTGPGGALITEFDGGYDSLARAGHGQEIYIDYLQGDGVNNEQLNAYLASIDEAGYGTDGESYAIDVSVPTTPQGGS